MNRFFCNIIMYLKSSIIRKLMFFYVLIIMIPILILGIFIQGQSVSYYNQKMVRFAEEYVNQVLGSIQKKISEYEYIAQVVRTNASVKNLLDTEYGMDDSDKVETINYYIKPFFSEIIGIDSSIYKVRVFYTRNQIHEVAGCFYDFSRVKDIYWYKNFMENSKFNAVGWNTSLKDNRFEIDPDAQVSRTVVSVLLKVYDKLFENVNGLLEIQINQKDFLDQMVNVQPGGIIPCIIIIDGNGNIVYDEFGDNVEMASEEWGGAINDVASFSHNLPSAIKDRYYTTYKKIEKLGYTAIYFFPIKEMNRENQRNISLIFLALFIGFVFLAIIAFILVKMVFSKLKKLLSALKQIQKGDLDFQLEFEENDEVGELSKNYNIMTGKIKELIQINVKIKLAEKEAQLKALQAQINPHFLYNSLNAIKMMAELKDDLAISDAISSLGAILRYNISGRNSELSSLGTELSYIRHYIRTQKLLIEDRADFSITVEPELRQKLNDCFIMKLLIQPVLENAIVHGIRDISVKGCVNIAVSKIDGNLHIKVTNNGNIIPQDKLVELNALNMDEYDVRQERASGYGIGIKNVQQRIRLYYGEEYGISIASSEETGTEVDIKIPYITATEEITDEDESGDMYV